MPRDRMPVDPTKMFLCEQPGRRHPTPHHVRIPPATHIVRAPPNVALRTLDNVRRRQALVQAFGIFSLCRVNISAVPSRKLRAAGRVALPLQAV